ncbi:hypothetical protein GCM10023176_29660 [Micromonospora coerulea]|uniref:Low molecular weight protein antigen 6 PH domain-containing protein n=1 Tax=Micromonospora coerulea TaxID=47856 RepID=A0ABP8SMT5_9ACTN
MPSSTVPDTSAIRPSPQPVADRVRVAAALVVAAAWAVAVIRGGIRGSWADGPLGTAPLTLGLSALVAMALTVGRPWRRPARLVLVRPGRLRVPAGSGFGWYVVAQVMILTGSAVPHLDVDPLRDVPAVTLAALAALVIAVLVAAVFDGRPRVDLTSHGIEARDPTGRRTIPWAALAAGRPLRQPHGHKLVLTVVHPELVEHRGLVRGSATAPLLTLTWLRVQPWFLADALRWYVDHPAERVALGTPDGDERLRRALGVG